MMEIAVGLVGIIVFGFLLYVAHVMRERRKPPPQVKGPIQRRMEDGSL